MFFIAGRMLLLRVIGLVGIAGHNIEEVEVREMILSAPVGATISDLPMLRYGF